MRIGSGAHAYQWVQDWARIPDTAEAKSGWAHPGVVVTGDGSVITFHQSDPTVLVFDQAGNLERSFNVELTEGHGITLVEEKGTESLWIADPGRKRLPENGYQYPERTSPISGQVVKLDLKGSELMRLAPPSLPVYQQENYCPTFVSVNEVRFGGNGDIWIADGYGQSYVHRYNKQGDYLASINGAEGRAGRFNCPHAIFIDRRKADPELYVADRTNRRVQVYDLDGNFKRAFGTDFLSSPSGFVTYGEMMVVAELRARLTVLDLDDNLVAYLGDNEAVCQVDGWPNTKDQSGAIGPTGLLTPGKFNSPHGMAVDHEGNLYVAEWLIGGRFSKLIKE